MNTIGFYKAHEPYGYFSNFYEAPIVVDSVLYKTSEHYYQACKFRKGSQEWLDIINCSTPQEVVKIARSREAHVVNWDDIKYSIMYIAILCKFTQHTHLRSLLKKTGDSILVEDTVGSVRPDEWWGNGKDGNGRNWLGVILMEVRSLL